MVTGGMWKPMRPELQVDTSNIHFEEVISVVTRVSETPSAEIAWQLIAQLSRWGLRQQFSEEMSKRDWLWWW